MKLKLLSGWGRNENCLGLECTFDEYINMDNSQNIEEAIAFGLNRSYGDSSYNSSGLNIRMTELNYVKVCVDSKTAICGAGCTIEVLESEALKFNLFPPVVPGTSKVTLGGAIASNIHGKSHHKYGSFGDNVISIKLLDKKGEIFELSKDNDYSDLFYATLGGMGLTGIIIEATIMLIAVQNPFFQVHEKRAKNFEKVLEEMSKADLEYDYTVAWIDVTKGNRFRGVITAGKHSEKTHRDNLPILRLPSKRSFQIPNGFSRMKLINKYTVKMFSTIWYFKPLKKSLQSYSHFLHPLDGIENWNLLYGKKGFHQIQFVVPYGNELIIRDILVELQKAGVFSFLTVLKRFGDSKSRFLSFPIPGWTVAIDLRVDDSMRETLRDIYEKLISVNGRIYLTKDSTLEAQQMKRMYPEIEDWLKVKLKYDPSNFWKSEQSKRLGLLND